ncbi:MAG: hypothetical protein KUF77_15435 [Candidatus Thiodiazotropha sp. (ex Lucina aurantia)]|nr:hypothetical protein [Candidatus Thiodiazotropha sp. (ex Lucina pensylvanica)]MBT3044320.1 hypothetical protein [Candidatus Thiodiazotropha sp. (ex Codakia orbicularis)]MBV2104417.1 hypothetical protein [Candidatus Thiodiazotropha sp. (ex Lucina aurantia)]MCG7862731.1 hypothetical protein [Candidatus Thiodiazotropha endolucinida]MBV2099518.1 hypothetical protein [Candidatus Thiodiazotropha sp. (ex Codakia orbicularis)]
MGDNVKKILLPLLFFIVLVALSIFWASLEGMAGILLHIIAFASYLYLYYRAWKEEKAHIAISMYIGTFISVLAWGGWIVIITANYAI